MTDKKNQSTTESSEQGDTKSNFSRREFLSKSTGTIAAASAMGREPHWYQQRRVPTGLKGLRHQSMAPFGSSLPPIPFGASWRNDLRQEPDALCGVPIYVVQ